MPVPGFGTQLNNRAIYGVSPEGGVRINYTEGQITTNDGAVVHLRTPQYTVVDSYQALPHDVELSPRVAPFVFGLGLLEAVPEATILALADEADENGDGISGKANFVWDVQKNGLQPRKIWLESESADLAAAGGFRIQRRHGRHDLTTAARELQRTVATRRTKR